MIKKNLIFIFCLLSTAGIIQAHEPEKYTDKEIEQLSKKAFRYSYKNKGKPSLTLISGYSGDITSQKWYLEGYGRPCNNNVVMLNRPGAARSIKGTSLILAFLDCPACNDGGEDFIIAFFDRNNTSLPLHFKHIKLMDKKRFYYWGNLQSFDVRKSGDKGYYVVAKLSGGDAGDSWTSLVFIFIDNNCNVTILSKLYASLNYDPEDENKCSGKELDFRFLEEHIVDVVTKNPCVNITKGKIKEAHNQYDLKFLYANPKVRIFKP